MKGPWRPVKALNHFFIAENPIQWAGVGGAILNYSTLLSGFGTRLSDRRLC